MLSRACWGRDGDGATRWDGDGAVTLLSRYRDDDSAPTLIGAGRDLILRGLVPAVVLFAVGLWVGWWLSGPIGDSLGEVNVNAQVQSGRTPALDAVARVASGMGSATGNTVFCVAAAALIWVLSRRWWLAALPVVALLLQVMVYIATSTLVGRQRPAVVTLDIGEPTASFPSGHMGATTAQLLVVVLFLLRWGIDRWWWRTTLIVTVTGYLLVLGWSRVYLGMHHVTDVVWGGVNGVACGLIGWLFLRRTSPSNPHDAGVRSLPAARD